MSRGELDLTGIVGGLASLKPSLQLSNTYIPLFIVMDIHQDLAFKSACFEVEYVFGAPASRPERYYSAQRYHTNHGISHQKFNGLYLFATN